MAISGVTGGTGTDSSLRPNKGHVKSASVSSGGPDSGTADPLRPRYGETTARTTCPASICIVHTILRSFVLLSVVIVCCWSSSTSVLVQILKKQVQAIIKRNLLVSPSTVVRVHHRRQLEQRQLFQETRHQEVLSIRDRQGRGRLMPRAHLVIHRMLLDLRSSQSSVRSFPKGKSSKNK